MSLRHFLVSAGLFLSIGNSYADYCAAIRGNGDAMPAHWGAFSSIVQEQGFPTAMAGGSSASITMFLIESLSLNSTLQTNTEKSLMVKSFQGYLEALTQTPEGRALNALLADQESIKELLAIAGELNVDSLNLDLVQKHLESIQVLIESDDFRGLINPEFLRYTKETIELVQRLKLTPNTRLEAQARYRQTQIKETIQSFGKFNAESDTSLFFRPGLIDFGGLAKVIGQMADFYTGRPLKNERASTSVRQDLLQFLGLCTPNSEGKSWRQINDENPTCRQIFGRAVLTYREARAQETDSHSRIYEPIGAHLATFPTTSVITGDAVQKYQEQKAQFALATESDFGSDFLVDQSELRFGYWGKEENLKQVAEQFQSNLIYQNDAKSQKFISLGDAPWLQALSTSPAEPGLASILSLDSNKLSAGGWSDLHPTLILQAHGCQNIIYISRKGGESFFAHGVIKKLTDIPGFEWDDYAGLSSDERYLLNAEGQIHDVGVAASEWSKLYNMANPQSSIRRSMRAASKVVCTDWDRHNSRVDMNAMIEEAMNAVSIKAPELCL